MIAKKIIKLIFSSTIRIKYVLEGNVIPLDVEIGSGTHLHNCTIGNYSYIGSKCTCNCAHIGNYTCIAPGVQIGGMEHSYWKLSTNPQLSDDCIYGKITNIGHDVWIAANAIIKQGVTIGDGAVVGACAFVNKDVPPYAIVVGAPAKILKYRFDDVMVQKIIESRYWDNPPKKAKAILEKIIVQ